MIMEASEDQNVIAQQVTDKKEEYSLNDPFPPPRSLDGVEVILKYEFKNKCLLEEALTHSSYNKCFSYERLEYVGDVVLNLLITKEQFILYPDLDPGHLTRLRAANVDTEKLARVSIKHGFHRYLRHKKPRLQEQIQEFRQAILEYPLHSNGLVDVPKDLADIVESIIGAVFIDCGFSIEFVWKIFKGLLEPLIDPDTIKKHPVTELYEVCQKQNLKIKFIDSWEKSMAFSVMIEEKLVGTGIYGSKKQIAQSRAAKDALNNIDAVLSTRKIINENVL